MKGIICLLFMLLASSAYAGYEKGTVDVLRMCGTGNTSSNGWIRTLQFKVNGKWFGTYADYNYSAGSTDYDNSQTTSLVLMAYAQKEVVEVNFTRKWSGEFTKCGNETGNVFYGEAGDYIQLSRE
ncbi:MAG: hypothetical protein JKY55_13990 [Aliivibrio sp.]|uniref:hypothetical protein n=1 Tax=Aliivibrio sp. TaxID=1872443 RepID=UPI001A626E44|nr:hypothetical protein [Aliivibrio sp.]